MNVTAEQLDAHQRGEPVPIEIDEIGEECVLLQQHTYDRMLQRFGQRQDALDQQGVEEIDPSFFEFDEVGVTRGHSDSRNH